MGDDRFIRLSTIVENAKRKYSFILSTSDLPLNLSLIINVYKKKHFVKQGITFSFLSLFLR
jgi:hypothetical protein